MSWSGGNDIVFTVAREAENSPDEHTARRMLVVLIDACRDNDCDTLYELYGEIDILDVALRIAGEAPEDVA